MSRTLLKRPEYHTVTAEQRARRRQQRSTPLYFEEAMYRTWLAHTTAHARDLGNPRRYPAVAERWSLALDAARAGLPLEGASDA